MGFDAYTDTSCKLAKMLEPSLEAIRQEAERLFLPREALGSSMIRGLEPLLSPYTFHPLAKSSLKEIALEGVPVLTRIAIRQKSQPDYTGNIAVRTIFGAAEVLPVRALSYLIPALHLVEAMRKSTHYPVLPQIQYIFMSEIGSRINALDRLKVQEQTSLFIKISRQFIQKYYPDLAGNVVFSEDDGFAVHTQIQEVASKLVADT
ncbi:hypothetical protein MUP32_02045, partial [Candidatus Microgenomates bacterium]|nr:hypothetical protein [Candidatus Microgenomates bacterium]